MTAAIDSTSELPRWDLDSIFPGPESPQFRAALRGIAEDIAALDAYFTRHGIGADRPDEADDALAMTLGEVINRYNALLDAAARINGYLYCLTAADVRDETAQRAAGQWRLAKADLARLAPRVVAWVGSLDLDALAARSAIVREHLDALNRIKISAGHLMEPGQEDLAAALNPSAGAAWMALRDAICGSAMATIVLHGEEQELPLSEIDNLNFDPDREVRRRAYEADQDAYHALAIPLAAAINGAKGQQLMLTLRRGWDDPLDQALFANAIDRDILSAMITAIEASLPVYHRYLQAKAKLLGLPRLAGYDILAPVGEPSPWPFETAREFILEHFAAASPNLATVAARAFADAWIDAGTRPGKDGGAFSVPTGGDESRLFLNYTPVYDWLSALAHELGHAYHAAVVAQAGRTALQAPPEDVPAPYIFPLTLAETASTFCEALIQRAARGSVAPLQEIAVLDGWLQAFSLNVFGTLAYFRFEQAFFAARRERELAASELGTMMAEARRAVSGEAIDPDTLWTTSWAAPHFYMDTLWYYNFPYAFGMLFAVGLLAARDAAPDGFFDRFETLLADSGMRPAADLAATFGIDLRDPAFWRTSLDVFRADVERYEGLANR
ncbi:MAG: M3 family metallopeptidase [Thermomicrobiales bacterium]